MKDCYEILGVKPSASQAEIKRAYRLRAKAIHPDLHGISGKRSNNDERMRELIRAYEMLSDPEQRAEFDAIYVKFRQYREGTDAQAKFDYRMWLMARSDNESRAKLIFFDLFHGFEDEAVAEYRKQRVKTPSFSLSVYFTREDFMDCGFILAEELFFREDFYEAFQLLYAVILLERDRPYFKHFYPEVLIFLRDIIKSHLIGCMADELALDCLESALELELGKKDDALILKLMAMCYERIGDLYTARLCVKEAYSRDSKLHGIKDLLKRLDLKEMQQ